MNDWFHIQAAHDEDDQVLHIKDVIGYYPNISEEIRWQMNQFDDRFPIEVRIDSIGGDPRTAKAIYTMLQNWVGRVDVIIENDCMSSATLIACAGDNVIMHDLATYMIHEPTIKSEDWMREDDAQSMTDFIRINKEHFVEIYTSFTGQDEETIRQWMQETKFFNAQEALDAGFVTEVRNIVPQIEAKHDYQLAARATGVPEERFKNLQGRNTSPETDNDKSEQNNNTIMSNWMKKIKGTFGLGDDSDEADIVLSAKELKAEVDELKQTNQDLTEQVETLEEEKQNLQEQLNEQEEAEEEAQEEELDTVLEAAVSDYKIKAGRKEDLKAEYEGDLPGLKKLLANIPEGAVKAGGSGKVDSPKSKAKGTRLKASGGVAEKVAADHGVK